MNLEDLNNEYLRLKAATKRFETQKTTYESDLRTAETDKTNAENNLKTATTKKDKQKYRDDLNEAKNRIQYLKEDLESLEKRVIANEGKIEELINQVKENPQVMEQCNRAIDIKTERQIAKFEKQKKAQQEKKENLEQLKNMIAKHPQATIVVNNIESKSMEISKKESDIKTVDSKIAKLDNTDPNYATDYASLMAEKGRYESERATLIGERQAERDKLKKLFNNQKYNEEIDNLTTRAALDKNIRNCDRLVKRSENKMQDYTYAKDSLYTETPEQDSPATSSKWETFKSLFRRKEPGDPSKWETFKSLFRRTPALPAPTAPETPSSFKDEIKLDSNIMKHEIVQEIYKETFEKKVEQGKSERTDEEGR